MYEKIEYSKLNFGITFKFNLDDKQSYIKVLPFNDDPNKPKRSCYVNTSTFLMWEVLKHRDLSDFEYIQNRTVFITE